MGSAMMKKEFPNTNQFTWTNGTGSAVAIGNPTKIDMTGTNVVMAAVVLNALAGSDGAAEVANGAEGQVDTKGRYSFPKATGALALLQTCWWDISANEVVAASGASGDFVLGFASKPAASGDAFVEIQLNEGPDRYTETA